MCASLVPSSSIPVGIYHEPPPTSPPLPSPAVRVQPFHLLIPAGLRYTAAEGAIELFSKRKAKQKSGGGNRVLYAGPYRGMCLLNENNKSVVRLIPDGGQGGRGGRKKGAQVRGGWTETREPLAFPSISSPALSPASLCVDDNINGRPDGRAEIGLPYATLRSVGRATE